MKSAVITPVFFIYFVTQNAYTLDFVLNLG